MKKNLSNIKKAINYLNNDDLNLKVDKNNILKFY